MSGPRLIVAIDASPGVTYGVRLVALLREMGIETHVLLDPAAGPYLERESGQGLPDKLAGEEILDPSFDCQGMIVAPCGAASLSRIALGEVGGLLVRAANAALDRDERLVLLDLATPLSLAHIRHMEQATRRGAILYPPVPALYARPRDLDEMVAHTLGRVLDLFDLESGTVRRWRQTPEPRRPRQKPLHP